MISLDISKDIVDMTTQFNKPYIVSLSGLSLADNLQMISKIFSSDVIKHFIKCCNTFFNDLLSNEPEGIKESTQRAIRSLQKIT